MGNIFVVVANVVTCSRFFIAPALWWSVVHHRDVWALFWLTSAMVSDGVDGYIARSRKATSVLGAYLDPLADKAVIFAGFSACAARGVLSWWIVGVIVLRDFIVTLLRHYAFKKKVPLRTTCIAKIKTAVQFFSLYFFIFYSFSAWHSMVAVGVALLTIISALPYGAALWKQNGES